MEPTGDKARIASRIAEIETEMQSPIFWQDKDRAKQLIREMNELKTEAEGGGKYDRLPAVVTILSGAGGDDAEDFSRMLFEMYMKFAARKGWGVTIIHEHENDHGGYRNLTFELDGKNAYGTLRNETGVHRLVRVSPFKAGDQRHTSFSLVEVVPKFEKEPAVELDERDIRVEFARSGGPGGQNVNKRETAVRVIHEPTGLSVHASSERSQAQNREKALAILKGKLYHKMEEDRKKREQGLHVSQTTEIEWGSQIRSYVLHPYKLVKDHRTGVETRDVESVLEGDLDEFIAAELSL
jgi:peptide chain release factor 2